MRLKAFRVTNYKTVLDSGRVELDTNVACLMGKNEAGKSAVMQALWKFNNVSGANYDRLHDLPAELYSRLRNTDPEVVVVDFMLEAEDKADFLEQFPALTTAPDAVTVHSTYDKKRTVEFDLAYTPPSYREIASCVKRVFTESCGRKRGAERAKTRSGSGRSRFRRGAEIGNDTRVPTSGRARRLWDADSFAGFSFSPTVREIFGDHGRPRPVPDPPVQDKACRTWGWMQRCRYDRTLRRVRDEGCKGLRIYLEPEVQRGGVPVLPKSARNHPHDSVKSP